MLRKTRAMCCDAARRSPFFNYWGEGAQVQVPVLERIERLFMRIARFRSALMGGRGQ